MTTESTIFHGTTRIHAFGLDAAMVAVLACIMVLIGLLFVWFCGVDGPDGNYIHTLSRQEVESEVGAGTALLIDARSPVFYELGHLPGAINMPVDTVKSGQALQLQDKDREGKKVIVYCSGPDCSDNWTLAVHLVQKGWKPIYLYPGGWKDWGSSPH